MLTNTTWFLVVLASSVAVAGACRLAAYAEGAEGAEPVRPGWRLRLGILGGCVILLMALAIAWRIRAVRPRSTVPSFLIASLLAVVYFQQTGRVRGFVLELLVIVQLLIQTGMTVLFNDITMTDLDPSVPLGGSGTIPSGSVSRLLSLFLVAATLWHGRGLRSERVLLSLAPLLVMTEIVSRLYLGRHLLADIAGGLLPGVILTVAFRWLLARLAPLDVEPGYVVRQ